MIASKLLYGLAASTALALAACEARFGNEAPAVEGNEAASAEGKAEEGRVTISAPGFDMKINIPEGLRRGVDSDSGIIYPNSTFSGVHVQGGPEGADGRSDGEVELRFTSADAPALVARWYQDPGRAGDFTIATAANEGRDFVIAGTTKEDGGNFRVRLAPRQGGGTDGRVALSDRR